MGNESDYLQYAINAYDGKHGKTNYEKVQGNIHKFYKGSPLEWEYCENVKFDDFTADVVSFRGSDDAYDWFNNFFGFLVSPFSLKKKPFSNMRSNIKMHIGMVRAYKRYCRDTLHAMLKSRNTKNLVIVGHSRGGGLALVASSDIDYNFENKKIITRAYGYTRIGNAEYNESRRKRLPDTIAYKFGKDVVPGLAPKMIGYRNVSETKFIGESTGSRIEDHRPKHYMAELRKLEALEEAHNG